MPTNPSDSALRTAAFEQVRRLQVTRDPLSADDLSVGFFYDGTRYPLINPQRGIFKPRQMDFLLSIRTVFPRAGNRIWYDDQRRVHQQIYDGEDTVDYAFMGTDPEAAENRWLKEAMDQRTPIIYFLGIAPGTYQALQPAFIVDWDVRKACAKVAFGEGAPASANPPSNSAERRYALRLVKQRLHQSTFRQAVIQAYPAPSRRSARSCPRDFLSGWSTRSSQACKSRRPRWRRCRPGDAALAHGHGARPLGCARPRWWARDPCARRVGHAHSLCA